MTRKELIEEARKIGGWRNHFGAIRTDRVYAVYSMACPIIAVANSRGEEFRLSEFVKAAKFLGLRNWEKLVDDADNGSEKLLKELTKENG